MDAVITACQWRQSIQPCHHEPVKLSQKRRVLRRLHRIRPGPRPEPLAPSGALLVEERSGSLRWGVAGPHARPHREVGQRRARQSRTGPRQTGINTMSFTPIWTSQIAEVRIGVPGRPAAPDWHKYYVFYPNLDLADSRGPDWGPGPASRARLAAAAALARSGLGGKGGGGLTARSPFASPPTPLRYIASPPPPLRLASPSSSPRRPAGRRPPLGPSLGASRRGFSPPRRELRRCGALCAGRAPPWLCVRAPPWLCEVRDGINGGGGVGGGGFPGA